MQVPLNAIVRIPGYYVTEKVYVGLKTLVYRGIREIDRTPVVIKVLRAEYPTFNEVTQFRNQYTIVKELDLPAVIKSYSLENYRNAYALIMEDFGGISLQHEVGKLLCPGKIPKRKYFKNIIQKRLEAKNKQANNKSTETKEKLQGGYSPLQTSDKKADFIGNFLKIGIQVCTALDAVHRSRIIHKDIKPANILINPQTHEVKLIDFSIASLLPKGVNTIPVTNIIEGTLAYLAPEQTGRVDSVIDYRTDFYSLGVTFFELLTGEIPFDTNDPLELIYSHIAKEIPLVNYIDNTIPPIIAKIVSKLMAKNPEKRYQSAMGLKHDLETCLQQWQEKEKIDYFELAQQDISSTFTIPDNLYGRETDIQILREAFERVCQGKIEVVFLDGESGVGKTALVNQINKNVAIANGYYITGKYEESPNDIPPEFAVGSIPPEVLWTETVPTNFSPATSPLIAFVEAIRHLIEQIETETDTQIRTWKSKILSAFQGEGRVITDIIPELEKIIGKQPEVTQLPEIEAKNRLHRLFAKLIYVFARENHPIVLFVDNLHWADADSFAFMRSLIIDNLTLDEPPSLSQPFIEEEEDNEPVKSLLLVGAYRKKKRETGPWKPIELTIADFERIETPKIFTSINIEPFSLGDVNTLISQTIRHDNSTTCFFSQMVFAKTQGNQFLSVNFLRSLYDQKLITFNFETLEWEYDIIGIKELCITDDVLDVMARELYLLGSPFRKILKLAACLDGKFNYTTLCIISQEEPLIVKARLWEALLKGLVIPETVTQTVCLAGNTDENLEIDFSELDLFEGKEPYIVPVLDHISIDYYFIHDRIKQAAYDLIPEDERKATHLRVGYLLVHSTPKSQREERIFELVNQFNIAFDLITEREELDGLAEMNLCAGRKALGLAEYSAAYNYLIFGIKSLAEDSWETNYEMSLALYETTAEAAYLSGHFEESEQYIDVVLASAKTLLEKIKVYEVKIQAYGAQNKALEGIDIALTVLEELGEELPRNYNQVDIETELYQTASSLQNLQIEDLIDLPEMSDTRILAVVRILANITAFAYQTAPKLFLLVVLKQVDLSIRYGNAPLSAFAYSAYAAILCGVMGEIESGYQFGELAINMISKLEIKNVSVKVNSAFNQVIRPWKKHIGETLSSFKEIYLTSVEIGDLEYVAYSLYAYSYTAYFSGKSLSILEGEMAENSKILKQIKQEMVFYWNEIYRQTVLNLINGCDNSHLLSGEAYDETKSLPVHVKAMMEQQFFSYTYVNCKSVISFLTILKQFKTSKKQKSICLMYLDY
ncbi:MAG: serine/threonine-protein kinase PknK [Calothrix sp. CSU_2_0]|nr:serine/threonine-protein kinase PknK [Calothrix sp. CSU_2_0]